MRAAANSIQPLGPVQLPVNSPPLLIRPLPSYHRPLILNKSQDEGAELPSPLEYDLQAHQAADLRHQQDDQRA